MKRGQEELHVKVDRLFMTEMYALWKKKCRTTYFTFLVLNKACPAFEPCAVCV